MSDQQQHSDRHNISSAPTRRQHQLQFPDGVLTSTATASTTAAPQSRAEHRSSFIIYTTFGFFSALFFAFLSRLF
jgi:hypothetical protein